MLDKKPPPDWQAIEHDYRNSPSSIREIAGWHGVTDTAIRKRAKASGWVRKADAPGAPVKKQEIAVTYQVERTVLTAEAVDPELIAARGQSLVVRMLDELDATTSRLDELEAFIAEATDGDESGRRREAMMRAISLPMRANTLKALAGAAKLLAETRAPAGKKAERQARAEGVASGGRFAPRSGPRMVVNNG